MRVRSEIWGKLKELLMAKAGTVCTKISNGDSSWNTGKFQSINVGEREIENQH